MDTSQAGVTFVFHHPKWIFLGVGTVPESRDSVNWPSTSISEPNEKKSKKSCKQNTRRSRKVRKHGSYHLLGT